MANIAFLNVYQFDNLVYDPGASRRVGFPTQGNILIWDTTNSPTRSLSSGVSVYSMLQTPSSGAANSAGHFFYVEETTAQLAAIFG